MARRRRAGHHSSLTLSTSSLKLGKPPSDSESCHGRRPLPVTVPPRAAAGAAAFKFPPTPA
eukprot:2540821-Rhodomonas_salina.1